MSVPAGIAENAIPSSCKSLAELLVLRGMNFRSLRILDDVALRLEECCCCRQKGIRQSRAANQ